MSDVAFRDACFSDIELLVQARLDFSELAAGDALYDTVKANLYPYYKTALNDGSFYAVFACDGDVVVGCGMVHYYATVPSKFNPAGRNAYVTNLTVAPAYRRRGIAQTVMERLVGQARHWHCGAVFLAASDMGRPLYKRMGFTALGNNLVLKLD